MNKPALLAALILCLSLPLAGADGTGLTGTYYTSADFSGSSFTRTDASINFDWGTGGPRVGTLGKEYFSVLWQGDIVPAFSETYTFYTTSDDGIMLTVNGKTLILNWPPHSPTENSGSITLAAGTKYHVILKYFQNRGGAVAKLSWSSPSTPKEIIPAKYLYPTTNLVASSPLAVLSPITSRISPAWLEGTVPETATSVTTKIGTTTLATTRLRAGGWYASNAPAGQPLGVTLSETATTTVAIASVTGSVTSSASVQMTWQATDLTNLPYGLDVIDVRPGDSLLLAATGAGSTVEIDTDFDGVTFRPVLSGSPISKFKRTFTRDGIQEIRVRRDGVLLPNKLKVNVVTFAFDAIACEVSFQRVKDISLTPAALSSSIVFSSNDPEWLAISEESATGTSVRLKVLPLTTGNRLIQARLGSEVGPIIAQRKVDAFTMSTSASMFIKIIQAYPDGSRLSEAELTMGPKVPDLSVLMKTFVSGVTFDDSTTQRTVSTTSFTASGSKGIYTYRLLRSPTGAAHWCHTFTVFQNGVVISR